MKIGVIGTMNQEAKILKEKLTDTMPWEQAGALFVSGSLGRHEMIVVRSGIGKMASTVTTTLLIHQYGVNMVVNTGSAGGIGEGLRVGDLVIADKLAYFDVDVTGFGYAYGQLPGSVPLYFGTSECLRMEIVKAVEKTDLAIRKGLTATGDTSVDSAEKIAKIKKEFLEVLACEAEGVAIGQAASQSNVPLLIVRAMGDIADDEAAQSFDELVSEAGKRLTEVVTHSVEDLAQEEKETVVTSSMK